jgi:hypothetical protein
VTGKLIVGRFPSKKKAPKRKRSGLALTHGATRAGRVFIAASGRKYYSTEEFTALLAELRETRDDALANRRARG